jgi:hypothetical protein
MNHDYQTTTIQDMDNFLHTPTERLYRLYWDCGMGKSYTIARWIALHPELKFLYVTVNHEVCRNFLSELEDAGVEDISHFKGKTQDDLCLQEEGCRYYPGCKIDGDISQNPDYTYVESRDQSFCNLKCNYKKQKTNSHIILTVFELIDKFDTDGRILIIDESPEQKAVIQCYSYEENLVLDQKWTYEDKFEEEHVYYTNVQLKVTFQVNNYQTWKIKNFFYRCRHNSVVGYPHKKGIQLHGRDYNMIPDSYSKIIFSCATTTLPLMEEILGIKADRVSEERKTLLNPIIEINHKWTKAFSVSNFKWFKNDFLTSLKSEKSDIFISTKKMFAEELEELGYKSPYHGNGRGINSYSKQYKYIIAYCRFGLPSEVNTAWELLGFNKALIKQREISESLQTFHRCRAHLHSKDTPIILMTNKEIGIIPNIEVSLNPLKKLIEYDGVFPSSLNKISKTLHISKRDTRAIKQTHELLY